MTSGQHHLVKKKRTKKCCMKGIVVSEEIGPELNTTKKKSTTENHIWPRRSQSHNPQPCIEYECTTDIASMTFKRKVYPRIWIKKFSWITAETSFDQAWVLIRAFVNLNLFANIPAFWHRGYLKFGASPIKTVRDQILGLDSSPKNLTWWQC